MPKEFRLIVLAASVILVAQCSTTDTVDPFGFVEGPYACSCERWYRQLDLSNGQWTETTDSLFEDHELMVLDSMSFNFWNGHFHCDLLSQTMECTDSDYGYMFRIPFVELYPDQGMLIYKEQYNSPEPAYGLMYCECIKLN